MRWSKESDIAIQAKEDVHSNKFDLFSPDVVNEIYNSRPMYKLCRKEIFVKHVRRYVTQAICGNDDNETPSKKAKTNVPAKRAKTNDEDNSEDIKKKDNTIQYHSEHRVYNTTPIRNGIRFVLDNPKDENPTGGIGFITRYKHFSSIHDYAGQYHQRVCVLLYSGVSARDIKINIVENGEEVVVQVPYPEYHLNADKFLCRAYPKAGFNPEEQSFIAFNETAKTLIDKTTSGKVMMTYRIKLLARIEQNFHVNWRTGKAQDLIILDNNCLLYTSPSPRDLSTSRMPSSA